MKNILMATVVLFGLTGVAYAADPVKADRSGMYIGGSIGSSTDEYSRVDLGVNAGYQFGSFVRAELDIDHAWKTTGTGDMVTGNLIGQYRIPNSTLTPYVLVGAGAGYGFDKLGSDNKNGAVALGAVGAGMRVAVSESVDFDFRYREVRPFDALNSQNKQLHLFSVGAEYRF